jgi:hypothetical protein
MRRSVLILGLCVASPGAKGRKKPTAERLEVESRIVRRLLLVGLLAATVARAQSACEAKCHQQASDCIKACTGDPKDAQKPEQRQKLMQCLDSCEQRTKQCKQGCPPQGRR